jgi:hypothetical protein
VVAEPMTMATDYALAAVAGCCCLLIFKRTPLQNSQRHWALAFAALAVAAALGGTHHGFVIEALWTPTVLAVGIASFAMLAGSAIATTSGRLRQGLIALALAKLLVYSAWMLGHDEFIYVVVDTGAALLAIAVLHLFFFKNQESKWMLAGVAVSLVAAAAQASGLDLHPSFNHNDLYHVVQIAAMALFYCGARRMQDRATGREFSRRSSAAS